MKRRLVPLVLLVGALGLSGCGGGAEVSTQARADSKITAGQAINSSSAHFRVGGAGVQLVKVVRLPAKMVGLRFIVHPPSSVLGCCTLFPRVGLTGSQLAGRPLNLRRVDVVEPESSFGDGGRLDMLLVAGSPDRVRLGSH